MEKIFEIVSIKQEIKAVPKRILKQFGHAFAEGKERYTVRSPEDAAIFAAGFIAFEDREIMLVLALNTKNQIIALHRAHVGSLNSSIVHPREVMKGLILNNAASFVLAHQHPSGDVTPSREDIEVTKRFVEVGKLMGISLLDHVVIGGGSNRFVSLREKGYVE